MKSHRSHRVAAAAAMALTLTLTGCAQTGVDPSAAAVSDGRVISEADVQTAVTELGQLQMPQEIDASTVTQYLVFAPYVRDNLKQAGVPVNEADVRKALPDPNATLSKPTLDVLTSMSGIGKMQAAADALTQQGQGATPEQTQQAQRVVVAQQATEAQLSKQQQDGRLSLNPKYMRGQENWIMQEAQPNMEQGQAPHGG